mgnify:CR=1 FL=1
MTEAESLQSFAALLARRPVPLLEIAAELPRYVAADIDPAATVQHGPARVVVLSENHVEDGLGFGQEGNDLVAWVRTEDPQTWRRAGHGMMRCP